MSFKFFFYGLLLLAISSLLAQGPEVERPKQPQLEIGAGFFLFHYNDYRGGRHRNTILWPLPYFIYRGKYVDAENSVINGYFYDKGRFRIGMSVMASLRVDSGQNKMRTGMPSLDPIIEVGPMAMYDLWIHPNRLQFLTLGVPIRMAVAAEFFYAKNQGYFTVPYLSYTLVPQPLTLDSFVQASVGVMFATQKYHHYYHGVEPQYETMGREAYRAPGGYSGTHVTLYVSKRMAQFYGFFFTRYDRLDGTAFSKSPLVERKDYYAVGGGLIWYFYQSKELEDRNRVTK